MDMKKSRSLASSSKRRAGMPIKEQCRQDGFSDATFYKWRAKFGGRQVTDAKRLRESENSKLKRLLAEAHRDIHALKDVLSAKPCPAGQTRSSRQYDC